jgi:multiple sugar transport system substrate-binding protein
MRKRLLFIPTKGRLLLFVGLIISLLLVACGKKEESPASTPTPETPGAGEGRTGISCAVYDWEQADYEDLVEAFEEANPDIHVRLVSINEILELDPMGGEWPDDAWQRLAARADVISLSVGRGIVQQGLVRDLAPFIQADPNFQQDDFYPGALKSGQWDGGTWTLPTRLIFELIFYDKDALDEAGVSYPEPGWTWDDFLTKAKALTVREGDKVTRWGFVQSWLNPLPFIEGRVGPLVDETTDPPTPRFDQPEVIEVGRWYANLYLKEEVMPYFEPSDEDEEVFIPPGQTMIENGEAAMWHESSSSWPWRKEQGNRGVVPYPVDAPDSRTTPIWVQGLSMSAGTAQPDAAWRWMDFLSRQAITEVGPFIQFLPARRSVAESSGFWEKVDQELAVALRYAIDHSYVRHWTTGYGAAQEALEAVLAGEKSVEDALAEAQTQAEADIKEERARQAEATPVPTFVVAAPEEDEQAGEGAVTITFSPGVGAFSNMQAYRDAARQFQEAHPNIHVEVKMPDFAGSPVGIQSMAESADCFQWSPDFQDPENQTAILNLEPFLDAAGRTSAGRTSASSFTTDDFYPSLLEQFTWQGQLWGLPAELQPYLIEYNQDLFDAAGVDYPALNWTVDDFFELAVALTRGAGDDKQYGFVPQAFEVNDLLLFIERRGAKLIDESADPPALAFNDPAMVEALRWYAGLSTEHEVKPIFLADVANVTDAAGFFMEQEALIREGRAGMWTSIGLMGMAGLGGGRDELNTGVVPLPVGADGAAAGGSTTGYFISAQTEARQACWQWITFLTGRPDLTQGLPARRSVAESDAYRQRVGAERAAAYQASVIGTEQASGFDIFSGQSWLGGGVIWLGRAYDQVVNDEASPEEALNAAQRLADDYRACIVAKDAFSDQEAWQACMLEVDSSLPDFLFNQSGGE